MTEKKMHTPQILLIRSCDTNQKENYIQVAKHFCCLKQYRYWSQAQVLGISIKQITLSGQACNLLVLFVLSG